MASRKTPLHLSNADIGRAEYRAESAIDRATSAPPDVGLFPKLADMRAAAGFLAPEELLTLARRAANVGLRGTMYSPDDRADVASIIVANALADLAERVPSAAPVVGAHRHHFDLSGRQPNGAVRTCSVCGERQRKTAGAWRAFEQLYGRPVSSADMARRDDPRFSLVRFCGDAHNLRRAIDARRAREAAARLERAAVEALAPSALGIMAERTPCRSAAIVARSNVRSAEQAATSIVAELGLPDGAESPAWACLYQWAREMYGADGEACAAEQSISHGAWRVRVSRGAKFLRGFYSADDLVAKLTLGAHRDAETGELVYVVRDASRAAHSPTPMLATVPSAPHWREPSYDRPEDADGAREVCECSKTRRRSKRDRIRFLKAKLAAATTENERARAIAALKGDGVTTEALALEALSLARRAAHNRGTGGSAKHAPAPSALKRHAA